MGGRAAPSRSPTRGPSSGASRTGTPPPTTEAADLAEIMGDVDEVRRAPGHRGHARPKRTPCSAAGWSLRGTTWTRWTPSLAAAGGRATRRLFRLACWWSPGLAMPRPRPCRPAPGHGHRTSHDQFGGALLSGDAARRRGPRPQPAGYCGRIGNRGVLVIKDVTSILSMNRTSAPGARCPPRGLRRPLVTRVGTDGGKTIPWAGRIVVIGAVTTAWDTAHAVIASMGDRFVLVRWTHVGGRRPAQSDRQHRATRQDASRTRPPRAGARRHGPDPIAVTDAEADVLLAPPIWSPWPVPESSTTTGAT